MLTLSRTLARANSGEPLPTVFRSLEERGIRPRRGQITMIAGQPNAGKSMLALFYALSMGEPTLYFSADSDEATQGGRAAAIVTGVPAREIEEDIRNGGLGYYQDAMADLAGIRMNFGSSPTLDDIELELLAYEEVFGRFPGLVVVDNLMNVVGEHESEQQGLIDIQKVMKSLCRETGSAIFLLHHCSEADGKPYDPPPRKAIMQKVSQLPELELTVAFNPMTNRFGIAAVKNRNGRSDAGAKDPVWIWADMDRGRFYEEQWQAAAAGLVI